MDVAVARAPAAHVVDDDEAARPDDACQFPRDSSADLFVRDRAEQGEREREVKRLVRFTDRIGAPGVDTDLGRVSLAVIHSRRVEVDARHVFWAAAPLDHQPEVVAGGATRFENARFIERVEAGAAEEAGEKTLAFLDHEEVARLEDGLVGHAIKHSIRRATSKKVTPLGLSSSPEGARDD